jgi:hypothetical protein
MSKELQDLQEAPEAERSVVQANGPHQLTGYVGEECRCQVKDPSSVLLAFAQDSTKLSGLLEGDQRDRFDFEGDFMRVTLTNEERLAVVYRGEGMFCWLVRGFRRYSPSPPAINAFMSNVSASQPVSLTWRTLPWNDGVAIVAGIGALGGEQVLNLVDDLYAMFKNDQEDDFIQRGLDRWQSQQDEHRQVTACAVLVTRRAREQWLQDVQAECAGKARDGKTSNTTSKEKTDGRV